MTFAEDLRTSVGSLKAVPGILVDDWAGLLDVDVFRGDNKLIPGLPGRVGVELVRDSYEFTVPFALQGGTRAELLTRISTVRALFPTTLLTLTRRQSTDTTPFYAATTCAGQYRGLAWTDTANPLDISGVLTFTNLDGVWA